MYKSGISTVTLSVSKSIETKPVTWTPSMTVTIPVIGRAIDGQRYIYGTPVKSEVIFGLNAAF